MYAPGHCETGIEVQTCLSTHNDRVRSYRHQLLTLVICPTVGIRESDSSESDNVQLSQGWAVTRPIQKQVDDCCCGIYWQSRTHSCCFTFVFLSAGVATQ